MVTMKPKAEEVQTVLSALSEDEVKQIRKENPFRNERNAKIRELVDRGVKVCIVAQISGFSPNMISFIRRRAFKILD